MSMFKYVMNIEAMTSFHCLLSYPLTAYTDYNYDHWLFVHL